MEIKNASFGTETEARMPEERTSFQNDALDPCRNYK